MRHRSQYVTGQRRRSPGEVSSASALPGKFDQRMRERGIAGVPIMRLSARPWRSEVQQKVGEAAGGRCALPPEAPIK